MSWIDIGHIDDIPERGARLVKTRAGCVAVFRTGPAEVFAAANACPHKGGPLSEGIVHGQSVTCPLHNWVFDLNSGQAQGEDGRVATYPVRLSDGRILLDASGLTARGPSGEDREETQGGPCGHAASNTTGKENECLT